MKTLLELADDLKLSVEILKSFDQQCSDLVSHFIGELDLSHMGESSSAADKIPAIRRYLLGRIAILGTDIQKGSQS